MNTSVMTDWTTIVGRLRCPVTNIIETAVTSYVRTKVWRNVLKSYAFKPNPVQHTHSGHSVALVWSGILDDDLWPKSINYIWISLSVGRKTFITFLEQKQSSPVRSRSLIIQHDVYIHCNNHNNNNNNNINTMR